MAENRPFKGVWIPAGIYENEELGWTEKMLLIEIESLSSLGECYALNAHFAKHLNLSKDRISKVLTSLNRGGYISIKFEYKKDSKEMEKRIISINKLAHPTLWGIDEEVNNSQKEVGESSQVGTGDVSQGWVGDSAYENNTVKDINSFFNNNTLVDSDESTSVGEEKEQKSLSPEEEKDKLIKNFGKIYNKYPKKVGKAKAFDYYRQYLKGRKMSTGTVKLTNLQIWHAVKKYVEEKESKETELKYYQDFSTFMNKTILDYLEE